MSHDVNYLGSKYLERPLLQRFGAELNTALPAALGKIAGRLGIGIPPTGVEIRLDDARKEARGLHAQTSTESTPEGPLQTVTLFAEYYAGRRFDLGKTLCHELVHALQRAAMGDTYQHVPRWLREGLALLVADQGEERIDTLLGIHSLGPRQDPSVLLLPLADHNPGLRHYAMYYAAVRNLDRQVHNALPELWAGLVGGQGVRDLVEDLIGTDFDSWVFAVHRELADDLHERSRHRHPLWRRLQHEVEHKEPQHVVRLAGEMIAGDTGAYTAPYVLQIRADAHQKLGQKPQALADLETIMKRYSHSSDASPKAAAQRCTLLHEMGQFDKAHAATHRFVRNYSYARAQLGAMQRLLNTMHAEIKRKNQATAKAKAAAQAQEAARVQEAGADPLVAPDEDESEDT